MININDDFILEKVKMLDFNKKNFLKLARTALVLNPKNDNRFLINFSSYDEEKINSSINFINRNYKENIIISKYILIILKLCNDINADINIKKMFDKTDKNNTIIIDASKIKFDKEKTIKYCYNMANYENYINDGEDEKSTSFLNEAEKIAVDWLEEVKDNEITYYDKDSIDGIICKNYDEVLDKIYNLNEKTYSEYPEQLDVPIELYDKYNIENYKEIIFCENEDFNEYIKKLEVVVDNYIESEIQKNGKVNGVDFIKYLHNSPYGFIVCKLTVYILMKVLKKYIDKKYYYFDDDIYEKLDEVNLESFIINSINKSFRKMPSLTIPHICLLDEKIIRYINLSKKIFGIDDEVESIASFKEKLRIIIENFKYPIWAIKYLEVKESIIKVIDKYCTLINSELNEDDIYKINEDEIVDSTLEILDNNIDIIGEINNLLKNENLEKGIKNLVGDKIDIFNSYINNSLLSDSWKWIWRENMVKETASII